jgi:hypothetical protein
LLAAADAAVAAAAAVAWLQGFVCVGCLCITFCM